MNKKQGFSLVEVTIALLVVGIGVMGSVALFPAGLDMNKKAVDETYVSFFVDSVFASFRGAQPYVPWNQLDSYEAIPPNTILNGESVFWNNPDQMTIKADGIINVIRFEAGSSKYKWEPGATPLPSNWTQLDHALSYRFTIQNPSQRPRIKELRLEVWANEYAGKITPEPTPDAIFYTELYNYGP